MTNHLDETAGRQAERLQGEGTYTYVCNKPGCYFCDKTKVYEPDPPRPPKANEWSSFEIDYVVKNWKLLSFRDMAIFLDRSEQAVRAKARKLEMGYKVKVWKYISPKYKNGFRVPKNFINQRTAQSWD